MRICWLCHRLGQGSRQHDVLPCRRQIFSIQGGRRCREPRHLDHLPVGLCQVQACCGRLCGIFFRIPNTDGNQQRHGKDEHCIGKKRGGTVSHAAIILKHPILAKDAQRILTRPSIAQQPQCPGFINGLCLGRNLEFAVDAPHEGAHGEWRQLHQLGDFLCREASGDEVQHFFLAH